MPEERQELENGLIEQAKQAIRTMLAAKDGRRDLSMIEMEDLVGDLETDFRQSVMQTLVAESQAKEKGFCPHCQGKLCPKGKKRKRVITIRGEVEAEREYYVCVECGTGYFPSG